MLICLKVHACGESWLVFIFIFPESGSYPPAKKAPAGPPTKKVSAASAKSKPTKKNTKKVKSVPESEKGKGRKKTATGGKQSSKILQIGNQPGIIIM